MAGSGTVTWVPELDTNEEGPVVTGGTLTLNNAQIDILDQEGCSSNQFINLPDVPVTIKLVGTNTFNTKDESGNTLINTSDFFRCCAGAIILDGSEGSIDSYTSYDLIRSIGEIDCGDVTISDLTFTGGIKAENLNLNNCTIPDRCYVDLTRCSNVTTTGVKNDGMLVLKSKDDNDNDSSMIDELNITGSGYVKTEGIINNLFFNDGTYIPSYRTTLNFSNPSEIEIWKTDATLETDGYEFTGDSDTGYKLKLGNIYIYEGYAGGIILPGDAPVEIILEPGTKAYIEGNTDAALRFSYPSNNSYPCTFTGSGKLFLRSYITPCIVADKPLIFEGGDITIYNDGEIGINVPDNDITVSGARLSITARTAFNPAIPAKAIYARGLSLHNMAFTSPAFAEFDDAKHTLCDADGNIISQVTLEPIIVNSVTVSPAATDVLMGEDKAFMAEVAGINDPAQTVIWSVSGQNSTSTTITPSGVLSVDSEETAKTLTVKATSTVDPEKSGTATVNVITPEYPVNLPGSTAYTITPETGSITPTLKGSSYSFKIVLNSNYEKGTDFAVKANGTALTDVSGVYTIKNINAAQTITVEGVVLKSADYSAVDAAIAQIPSDLTTYTDETVQALTDAKNAVVRGKNITEQATVDGYVIAIKNAISSLEKKQTETKTPEIETESVQTGDNSNLILWITLLLISGSAVTVLGIIKKRRHTNAI